MIGYFQLAKKSGEGEGEGDKAARPGAGFTFFFIFFLFFIYLFQSGMIITSRIIFKTTFRCPHDTIVRSKYNIQQITRILMFNVQVQVLSPLRLGEKFCFYRVTLNI